MSMPTAAGFQPLPPLPPVVGSQRSNSVQLPSAAAFPSLPAQPPMPNFPTLPAQPPMPQINPPAAGAKPAAAKPAADAPASPGRKADVVENLKKRFPKATDDEIAAALAGNDNHAGRAAQALEKKAPEKPKIDARKISMAFNLFDTSGDGAINFKEFKAAVDSLGFIGEQDLSDEEVHEMYVECDTSGDGLIQLDEFKAMMLNQLGDENAEARRARFATGVDESIEAPTRRAVGHVGDKWAGEAGAKKERIFAAARDRQDAFQEEVAAKYGATMANCMAPAATQPAKRAKPKKASSAACSIQ